MFLWYAFGPQPEHQAPCTSPDHSPSVLEISSHLPCILSFLRDTNPVPLCTRSHLASLRLWQAPVRPRADRWKSVIMSYASVFNIPSLHHHMTLDLAAEGHGSLTDVPIPFTMMSCILFSHHMTMDNWILLIWIICIELWMQQLHAAVVVYYMYAQELHIGRAGQHFELFDLKLSRVKKVTTHNHSLRVQYVR